MSCSRQPVTITEPGLLSLLQISDSFFPTGSFTQSYGLETYVQEGLVNSKESLADFLVTYLLEVAATSDGLAMVLAHRAAAAEEWRVIIELDQILDAQKLARESRQASAKTGCRLLRAAMELCGGSGLTKYSELIKKGKVFGHHASVFGVVTGGVGLAENVAALAFMYTATAGMVNNAVRLIPLGQQDGQWVLTMLRDAMQQAAQISLSLGPDDLGATAPALEIRSMQHERLYSRLFMS